MDEQQCRQIAIGVFEDIQKEFPHLKCLLETEPKIPVDVYMDIPKQSHLDFDIAVYLSGDELHLSVDPFWVEWFPCTNPKTVSEYLKAVRGLLSGRFRIVEYYKDGRPVRAVLEEPVGDTWATVTSWGRLHFSFGKKTTVVKQNKSAP